MGHPGFVVGGAFPIGQSIPEGVIEQLELWRVGFNETSLALQRGSGLATIL